MSIKKIVLTFTIISAILIATGCGTAETNGSNLDPDRTSGALTPEQGEPDINPNDKTGIWAGELTANLVKESFGKYILSVQNHKTHDVTLTFPSSQVFDYSFTNEEGEIVYTYSADKSFMLMISEKVLKAGEVLDTEVDVTEGLANLEAGKYTLKIWLATSNDKPLEASLNIDYDGTIEASLPVFDGEIDGQNDRELESVTEGTGTIIGQIDNNSIEIETATGVRAYRLTEKVELLPDQTKVNFAYKELDNGQLELTFLSEVK